MNKDEVMEILEHNWTCLKNSAYTDNELDEALEYIIKALEPEQELKTEPCEDCISRKTVVEILNRQRFGISKMSWDIISEKLSELPSVNPQPICEEREKGECPYYAG